MTEIFLFGKLCSKMCPISEYSNCHTYQQVERKNSDPGLLRGDSF